MSILFKIIYSSSVIFIALCLIIAALLKILPIEFSSESYQAVFDDLFFWGIPVATFLTISKIFYKNLEKDRLKQIAIKTIVTSIIVLLLLFVYSFFSIWSGMCSWSNEAVIFAKRTDNSVKIIKRSFGCGATDSSPATIGFFQVEPFAFLFNKISRIDTTKINRVEWINTNGK